MVPIIVRCIMSEHAAKVTDAKKLSLEMLHPWMVLKQNSSLTKYFVYSPVPVISNFHGSPVISSGFPIQGSEKYLSETDESHKRL